jgi:hypothetical protein
LEGGGSFFIFWKSKSTKSSNFSRKMVNFRLISYIARYPEV